MTMNCYNFIHICKEETDYMIIQIKFDQNTLLALLDYTTNIFQTNSQLSIYTDVD